MADASSKRRNQLFRINKAVKKVDDSGAKTIAIEANHVAGDIVLDSLKKNISLANANPKQFWNALVESLSSGTPEFSFSSDIKTVANINLEWKQVST
ncbi:hypothetical protein, partial [Corynebacterium amycolatum]